MPPKQRVIESVYLSNFVVRFQNFVSYLIQGLWHVQRRVDLTCCTLHESKGRALNICFHFQFVLCLKMSMNADWICQSYDKRSDQQSMTNSCFCNRSILSVFKVDGVGIAADIL